MWSTQYVHNLSIFISNWNPFSLDIKNDKEEGKGLPPKIEKVVYNIHVTYFLLIIVVPIPKIT